MPEAKINKIVKCGLCGKEIKVKDSVSFTGHLSWGYGFYKYACKECYKEYVALKEYDLEHNPGHLPNESR